MNPVSRSILSFTFAFIVIIIVTTIVSSIVRRSSSVAKRKATRPDVLFIVCFRRWASILIRTVGIAIIVVGCLLGIGLFTGDDSMLGMGLAGAIMAVVGLLFVWLAHGMVRMRLEVTADTIWMFPMMGTPRKAALSDVTSLSSLKSNNYGGIVALSGNKHLFYASRVMLGYPQLIEYFQTRRPDLTIPDVSMPL